MTAQIVPVTDGGIIISVEYDATGLLWAALYDNRLIAWHIEVLGSALPPVPQIIGKLPTPAPASPPVISPQWAVFENPAVIVPDLWRGNVSDFFTWLATKQRRGEAARKALRGQQRPGQRFDEWGRSNPDLVVQAAA